MFKVHPLQYSCTTVQYSFDPAFLPLLGKLALRLGLEAKIDEVSGRAIVARLERMSAERKVYISHQSGVNDYRRGEEKEEFIDYYKLLCLAKDVDAEINMSFDGTPRHTGFDYCFPKAGWIGDTHWTFAHLTDDCNLNYKYCYSHKQGKKILLKDLKKIVQETNLLRFSFPLFWTPKRGARYSPR